MNTFQYVCTMLFCLSALTSTAIAGDAAVQKAATIKANIDSAEPLDYKVVEGTFVTSEGTIPNGCFGQLVTELNGDNSVATIFLNKNTYRGCITANDTYPGGNGDEVSYKIIKPLEHDSWNLRICQTVNGSMGQTCDNVTVQFVNRKYTDRSKTLTVLSLEKLGEW